MQVEDLYARVHAGHLRSAATLSALAEAMSARWFAQGA